MNVNEVVTTDWQMSKRAPGEIVQGIDDINQCFGIILSTQKGTDPLRPDFGLDLLSYIDTPSNISAPLMVKDMIEQAADYEPRVTLTSINYSTPLTGKLLFSLTWEYAPGILATGVAVPATGSNTTYFLLADNGGFVLLSDYDVSLILA